MFTTKELILFLVVDLFNVFIKSSIWSSRSLVLSARFFSFFFLLLSSLVVDCKSELISLLMSSNKELWWSSSSSLLLHATKKKRKNKRTYQWNKWQDYTRRKIKTVFRCQIYSIRFFIFLNLITEHRLFFLIMTKNKYM
jgi:hypothetical protein